MSWPLSWFCGRLHSFFLHGLVKGVFSPISPCLGDICPLSFCITMFLISDYLVLTYHYVTRPLRKSVPLSLSPPHLDLKSDTFSIRFSSPLHTRSKLKTAKLSFHHCCSAGMVGLQNVCPQGPFTNLICVLYFIHPVNKFNFIECITDKIRRGDPALNKL